MGVLAINNAPALRWDRPRLLHRCSFAIAAGRDGHDQQHCLCTSKKRCRLRQEPLSQPYTAALPTWLLYATAASCAAASCTLPPALPVGEGPSPPDERLSEGTCWFSMPALPLARILDPGPVFSQIRCWLKCDTPLASKTPKCPLFSQIWLCSQLVKKREMWAPPIPLPPTPPHPHQPNHHPTPPTHRSHAHARVLLPLPQDHKSRPSAKEALKHPWLQENFHTGKKRPISATVVQRIQVRKGARGE